MEKNYKAINKNNVDYDKFKEMCYELAEKEPDVDYAREGLDYADKLNGINELYNEGKSVDETVYLLCM